METSAHMATAGAKSHPASEDSAAGKAGQKGPEPKHVRENKRDKGLF